MPYAHYNFLVTFFGLNVRDNVAYRIKVYMYTESPNIPEYWHGLYTGDFMKKLPQLPVCTRDRQIVIR